MKTCYTITMYEADSHCFQFAVYKNGKTIIYGWAVDERAVLKCVLDRTVPDEPQTETSS